VETNTAKIAEMRRELKLLQEGMVNVLKTPAQCEASRNARNLRIADLKRQIAEMEKTNYITNR